MMNKLVITEGPDAGRSFDIPESEPLVIGRGSSSDTQIRDPRLSRVHCELVSQDEGFLIKDCGSAAGTFVDAMPILEPKLIEKGALIQIGDSILRIDSGSPLDTATIRPATQPVEEPVRPMHELVGEVFYRYRLDELVSSGKNSAVFRAWDQRRDRQVAVKILKPQFASSEQQKDRFIRAMRTMLPIRHPNIVRLRKAGRSGPYCWAAMEWIAGTSVSKLIDEIGISGMLDWKEVWRVAVHIGRALKEAEKQHIVHRNLTPSNILRRGEDRAFLLSDLIFARALDVTDSAQITRPGDIVGQLAYMAPERLLDPTYVDIKSDMYGLGATLYAMLTGEPPFSGLTIGDLLEKIRVEDPKLPSTFQMGIDDRFQDVVMKLLAKTPDNRFSSPTGMLNQLMNVGKLGGIEADWSHWVD